jgi:hypothetical protein
MLSHSIHCHVERESDAQEPDVCPHDNHHHHHHHPDIGGCVDDWYLSNFQFSFLWCGDTLLHQDYLQVVFIAMAVAFCAPANRRGLYGGRIFSKERLLIKRVKRITVVVSSGSGFCAPADE